MSKTIPISQDNARKAYKEATGEVKKALLNLIGKSALCDDITEIVDSYETACELEGTEPLTIDHFKFLPERDREYHFTDHKLNIIRRALNEGWEWKEGERGYYPVFNRASGGSGFSIRFVDCFYSASGVGARRTYKNEALAMASAKKFLPLHSIIQNNE